MKVAYVYDEDVGNFYYGPGHPMKPRRIRMAHQLIVNYQLHQLMDCYRPHWATAQEMKIFHSPQYVDWLKQSNVCPKFFEWYWKEKDDCPQFADLYNFTQITTGASIDCAKLINHNYANIAINWSGGLHHAKKEEPSGFCYINDIVLCILELLKYHARVLYIDVDIHHGDGVEEAFYTTNRVFTLSLHKYGNFFPGTGHIEDIGVKEGKYYTLNIPLKEGINDQAYRDLFRPILAAIMQYYDPGVVVLQLGADSLARDRLGCFNLTLEGHGDCLKAVMEHGRPVVVLGGGGYTMSSVARCWAYETALCLKEELPNQLPFNDYYNYYGPFYDLHFKEDTTLENQNSQEFQQLLLQRALENIKLLEAAPNVKSNVPPGDMFEDVNKIKSKSVLI